ncbi:N-acyl amino acid synthase FeeM domain-containing protein [Massilia sp. DWR3-1-1]|uniref:N-acyl amino acid synthase FeeM domain-containing protein n=1 Tax=Massilia sp. DWR3-1-1 TaxID=2804559 RepID=UPI003CE68322
MEQLFAVTPTPSSASPILAGRLNEQDAVERLPFIIKRVETAEDMRKAVQVRHAAYARHVPAFAETLLLPEDSDYDDNCIVLLAESKLDGTPLGSTRIQTNLYGPLHVESSITLPDWLQGVRLAEVTRLGIDEGRVGRIVKIALIKACFEYCENHQIEHAVVTGRAPIDRQYEQLMFRDVFEDKAYVPLHHVGNIAHRVMAFEIATGEARWSAAKHPLLKFFKHTRHPDIDIGKKSATRLVRGPGTDFVPEMGRARMHAAL